MPTTELVAIAILAKAPIPGLAKTRLIPALGAHGAAMLQEALTARAVETAFAAQTGPVTLWATPDATHPSFRELAVKSQIAVKRQPEGDLGARMLAACDAIAGPILVVGTDCPSLSPAHLQKAADALRHGSDVVVIPAEDGGYVLIGMRNPQPHLFGAMPWGTDSVMTETRGRIAAANLRCRELPTLWDIDRPDDLEKLRGDPGFARFF
ncbi:MAG TPA: TIGR04282 family arsenosugar biosynthesis glycosyltransferase [Pseudorhodoplanes sp.]|nr:TIGR04282 family arsenosugar biosynthesis glycosyltransferase [Pseudorhodoplanes sp.]